MKKQKKYTKRRLSKWVLLTLPTSALKKMDSETLNKYAKMYGVKSPKGKPSYTDKELVRELSKFIYAEKKRRADYWECEKKGKKKFIIEDDVVVLEAGQSIKIDKNTKVQY